MTFYKVQLETQIKKSLIAQKRLEKLASQVDAKGLKNLALYGVHNEVAIIVTITSNGYCSNNR